MDTPLQPAELAHRAAAVDMSSIPSKNGSSSLGVLVSPTATPDEVITISAAAAAVAAAAGPDASVEAVPAELDRYFFDAPGDSARQVRHRGVIKPSSDWFPNVPKTLEDFDGVGT